MNDRPVLDNLSACPPLAELSVREAGPLRPHRQPAVLSITDPAAVGVSAVDAGVGVSGSLVHLLPGPVGGPGLPWHLTPGATYTASVDVTVTERLVDVSGDRIRLTVHAAVDGRRERLAASLRAPNEAGRYRVHTTFTVPEGATRLWFGLVAGDRVPAAPVVFSRLAVTAGRTRLDHFDGDTPATPWHSFEWLGEPRESASRRTPRDPAQALADIPATERPRVLVHEIEQRLAAGLCDEAAWLARHLPSLDADQALLRVIDARVAEGRERWARPPEVTAEADWHIVVTRAYDARSLAAIDDPATASPLAASLVGVRLARGNARARLRQAVPLLRRATEHHDDPMAGYALGWALHQVGSREESTTTLAAAAAADRDAPFDPADAVAEHPGRMAARREVANFLAPRLEVVRERAEAARALEMGDLGPSPVFMYWGQGWSAAPPVARACREALRAHNPAEHLHLLDDDLLSSYSEMPDHVQAINPRHRAAYSDALRLDLLVRHGGTWLDATCFTTGPVAESVRELHDGEFFAFRRSDHRFNSWLLSARPSSYLLRMLRAAFFLWWEERDDLVDYFLVHHVFEMLARLDGRFAQEWAALPAVKGAAGHRFQHLMFTPSKAEQARRALEGSFVHKLTTGYDDQDVHPGTPLAALLRGALP